MSFAVCYILLTMEDKIIQFVFCPFEKMQLSENRHTRKLGNVLGWFWAMGMMAGILTSIGMFIGRYGFSN